MHLQVQPTPEFPSRVILNNDIRTLLEYGLRNRELTYNINMYDTPDPIPEGDPPGSMGYQVFFKMMSGQHRDHDILLRGLGSTYTVGRVMNLLQEKCGIPPDYQVWQVPVVNLDSPLKNYPLEDGAQIRVWDARVARVDEEP